jgi:hypothetical protein
MATYLVPRTPEDIQALVRDRVEEGLHLEYKSISRIQSKESYRKEITKDVSAMANAGGGVIVYGIEEDGRAAVGIKGSTDESISKEWFENIIRDGISPSVSGLEIIPIRIEDHSTYVVHAPKSMIAPHQGIDKRYYARRNFRVDVLNDFEITDLRSRRAGSGGGVFIGFALDGPLVYIHVINENSFPVFNAKMELPEHLLQYLPRTPKILTEGVGVIHAKGKIVFLIGSFYELSQNPALLDEFEYVSVYYAEKGGPSQRREVH